MPENAHSKHKRRRNREDSRKDLPAVTPKSDEDSQKRQSSTSTEDLSLVPTALDTHRRDFFKTYPIDVDGKSLEALDEHLRVLHGGELVLEVRGGSQHPVLASLFTASLQDPCLFTCFLAAAQGIFEQRRSVERFEPSDHLISLQARGLGAIRDRVMQAGAEQDDRLIASILQLMVTDSVCGNTRSLISHQRGARKLIAMRKGDPNDPVFQTSLGVLVVIEFYVALVQFLSPEPTTPPAEESPLRYLKHPFPAPLCVRISKLPPGLQDLALQGTLSLQTLQLLEVVTGWSSALQGLTPGTPTAEAAYRRLFSEPMDCSRSAVFILRHLRQSHSELTIEYMLCVGITIIIKHQRTIRKTDHLDDELLHVFIHTVKQFAHPTKVEAETIIWLVTVVAWRTSATFPAHAEDVVDHVLRIHESARDMENVQALWARFLWYERFGGRWTRYWQAGLDRLHMPKLQLGRMPSTDQHACPGAEPPQNCSFSRGMARIKEESSAESVQSLSGLTSNQSWTQSDDGVRSLSDDVG